MVWTTSSNPNPDPSPNPKPNPNPNPNPIPHQVPLISVLLGMDDDFGVRTWLACVLSCGAAVVVAIIDSFGDHGGAAALDLPGAAALVASAVMYATFR